MNPPIPDAPFGIPAALITISTPAPCTTNSFTSTVAATATPARGATRRMRWTVSTVYLLESIGLVGLPPTPAGLALPGIGSTRDSPARAAKACAARPPSPWPCLTITKQQRPQNAPRRAALHSLGSAFDAEHNPVSCDAHYR